MLNLIAGIDTPDAGRVIVAGIDLTGLAERDRTLFRREHIGFVYQAFNLVPTLNVADNIVITSYSIHYTKLYDCSTESRTRCG